MVRQAESEGSKEAQMELQSKDEIIREQQKKLDMKQQLDQQLAAKLRT